MQVLDCLAIWQRRFREYNELYHFVYHTELFVSFDMDNDVLREMMFIQAVSDVQRSHYPCTEVDRITLLALAIKAEHGDKELSEQEIQ